MSLYRDVVTLAVLCTASFVHDQSVHAQPPAQQTGSGTPQAVVRDLYDSVTFEPGHTPDWEHVKSMFIDEAVIVLRSSRTETTIHTVDSFVNDFKKFIADADLAKRGFEERIVKMKPFLFGDIAHVLVYYEAEIPGASRGPQSGVDSFQLIKKNGNWHIVSITNELPSVKNPLPEDLKQDK